MPLTPSFCPVACTLAYTRDEADFCGCLSCLPSQRAKPATKREMSQFHSDEYVEFLARISPENMSMFAREQSKCTATSSKPSLVAVERRSPLYLELTLDRSGYRQRRG